VFEAKHRILGSWARPAHLMVPSLPDFCRKTRQVFPLPFSAKSLRMAFFAAGCGCKVILFGKKSP
jgi:hypothetical protein